MKNSIWKQLRHSIPWRLMNARKLLLLIPLVLCSYQAYKTQFDCPPGKGVPCTSVSEIQSMIIETPEGGPDIFLGKIPRTSCTDCKERRCRTHPGSVGSNAMLKRVWVEGEEFGCSKTDGHYIYFQETCGGGECSP